MRLITVDLIRGIAICLMTFAHILDELVLISPEFFTEYLSGKEIILLSPIIVIMVLFGSLKQIFGYVGGAAFAINFVFKIL